MKRKKKKRGLLHIGLLVLAIGLLSGKVGHIAFEAKVGKLENILVESDRLKADVFALTGTDRSRNYQNKESLEQAANYIKTEWEKLGLVVEEQPFEVYNETYKNILCSFGPVDAPRIVVGAHYDVCGEQPGADDNASGVAGLLELARLLKDHQPVLKYRVDLVAYTLEEPPFFRSDNMGSAVHARSLTKEKAEIRGMICLEMIGYFSDEKSSQDYPLGILKLFYPTKGDFIAVVGKLGHGKLTRQVKRGIQRGSDIPVESISAPASLPGIDFSDHLNYWEQGFEAVMITNTAFYRNKEYHEKGDTPERLDYVRMAEVVKGIYHTVVTLK